MNPRHFRLLSYFAEVARAGSVRGAAARLSLSPAVVSAALYDLEEILGTTLIRRSTRRMELTHDGQRYLSKAMAAIDAFEAAFEDVNTPATRIEGRVAISLPSELAAAWIPTVIKEFKTEYPRVETHIHADDTKIDSGAVHHDIAIRMEFQKTPRLTRSGFAAYPLELVCGSELAGSLLGNLTRDLTRLGFLGSAHQLRGGQLYCIETATGREVPIPVQPTISIDNRHVVLDLTRQGFGAALLLSLSVTSDLQKGRLLRVTSNHSFGYVVARTLMLDKRPSPAARTFRDFVKNRHGGSNQSAPSSRAS